MKSLQKFAELFNLFLEKSNIGSVRKIRNVLIEKGYYFDESTLYKWSSGTRAPRERDIVLQVVKIFIENGGIQNVHQVNEFLHILMMGNLSQEEEKELRLLLKEEVHFNVPDKIPQYIERDGYVHKMAWHLLQQQQVYVYGLPGSGKTTLSIHMCHELKHLYPDGIFWFRADIVSVEDMLDYIGRSFGEDTNSLSDYNQKKDAILSMVKDKFLLFVFDNIERFEEIYHTFYIAHRKYCILANAINMPERIYDDVPMLNITQFTIDQASALAQKTLGKHYIQHNFEIVESIAREVLFSPLALSILFRKLKKIPSDMHLSFVHTIGSINIDSFKYDQKSLAASFQLMFDQLKDTEQQLFISLAVYKGVDFSTSSFAYLHNLTEIEVEPFLESFRSYGLIEKSTQIRYRIHPFVPIFVRKTGRFNQEHAQKLLKYYIYELEKYGPNNSQAYGFCDAELSNIMGSIDISFEFKYYQEILIIWPYLSHFLWDSGRWKKIEKLKHVILTSCKELGDIETVASLHIQTMSWLYFWYGDEKKAEDELTVGVSLINQKQNEILYALAKQRNGMIQLKKQNLVLAEEELLQSIEVFKRKKLNMFLANSHLFLAHVYKQRNRSASALKHYKIALRESKKFPEHESQAIALYYIGELYIDQKDYDKALSFFIRSLEIDRKRNRLPGIPWCMYGIGLVKMHYGEAEEAKELFFEAKKRYEKIGMLQEIPKVEEQLALIEAE